MKWNYELSLPHRGNSIIQRRENAWRKVKPVILLLLVHKYNLGSDMAHGPYRSPEQNNSIFFLG